MRIILAFAFEAVDSGGLFFTNECRTGCQPVPAPKQLTPKTGWQPVLRFPGIESFRLEARKTGASFYGTNIGSWSYIDANAKRRVNKRRERERGWAMKEAGDVLRVVGMILLALFVLAVGVPLVLAAAGVALGILGFLVGLAVLLIKVAVVVAVIYLIVVGIRAVLR